MRPKQQPILVCSSVIRKHFSNNLCRLHLSNRFLLEKIASMTHNGIEKTGGYRKAKIHIEKRRRMSVNREYKNSLFTTLFNDAEKLLSLYNALSGGNLPLDTPVEIAMLDDVLFVAEDTQA